MHTHDETQARAERVSAALTKMHPLDAETARLWLEERQIRLQQLAAAEERCFIAEQHRDDLLAAGRKIEAHSFYNAGNNAYIVDAEAMDELCEVITRSKGGKKQ